MAEASVILLTRARTRNGGRKILNLHEIILYLRTRYNTTLSVFQSGHNLAQNQAFFGKARLVIGVHGGAFYNINFCPSETIVAEYVPLSEHNTSFEGSASRIVWFMANMNGQRYYRLAEKPISGNNLQISVQKLKTLLDEVDKIQLKTSS